MRFQGKTVVVTGAAAGVGRATVHRFARDGANLGLIARDQAALEAVEREVAQYGGRTVAPAADVSDDEQVFEPETAAHAIWRAAATPRREYWLGRSTILTVLGDLGRARALRPAIGPVRGRRADDGRAGLGRSARQSLRAGGRVASHARLVRGRGSPLGRARARSVGSARRAHLRRGRMRGRRLWRGPGISAHAEPWRAVMT